MRVDFGSFSFSYPLSACSLLSCELLDVGLIVAEFTAAQLWGPGRVTVSFPPSWMAWKPKRVKPPNQLVSISPLLQAVASEAEQEKEKLVAGGGRGLPRGSPGWAPRPGNPQVGRLWLWGP